MLVHQVYAMVDKDEIVQNITVGENYEDANRIARAVYGDNAFAVDCLQYPCSIGNIYHDGRFWELKEDGTKAEIDYVPTQEQQVQSLQAENDELTLVVADLIGGAT